MRGRAGGAALVVVFVMVALVANLTTASAAPSSRPPTISVIVNLRVPFGAEGTLTAARARAQRTRIADVRDRVEQLVRGGEIERRYTTVPAVAIEATPAELAALRASPDVESISPNVTLEPTLSQSVPRIGAPTAWSHGHDGTGQAVAIVDTGVDYTHEFLGGGTRVLDEVCFARGDSDEDGDCPNGQETSTAAGAGMPCPWKNCDHGTHVAGIAVGKETASTPGAPASGVAKGANFVAVQVFSRYTCGLSSCAKTDTSDVLAALDWLYEHHTDWPLASINLSVGGGEYTQPCDSEFSSLKHAIDNLRSVGVATVISSGNSGYPYGISVPSCISSAVSVGSTRDDSNTISGFSNTDTNLSLLAPGENITSSVPNGQFKEFDGTSMAAPHVTGTWAILRQARPHASVSRILHTLQRTGVDITETDTGTTLHYRRINVGAADTALREEPSDFNGDGYADLAIGAPGEDVNGAVDAGAVNVVYGSAGGLVAAGNLLIEQGVNGVLDTAEAGDRFGAALAWGDFNGDRYDDLAISAPNEDVDAVIDAGAVSILYGSAAGLVTTGNELFTQDTTGVLNSANPNDRFGSSLAAGDVDGDRRDDLLVGVPFENAGTTTDAGRVALLFGASSGGVNASGNKLLAPPSGESQVSLKFGTALAAGDFDGNGGTDIAVGAPGRSVSKHANAGAVYTYRFTTARAQETVQKFTQDWGPIQDRAELSDGFGRALAAGNPNNDRFDDLAIGVPGENVGSVADAGVVHVLFGGKSDNGLGSPDNQLFRQGSGGITDTAEAGDRFGAALAFTDADGDGMDDLVVGVPDEDVLTAVDGGAVHVLWGKWSGVTTTDSLRMRRGLDGLSGAPLSGDQFGARLAGLDLDGSGSGDLAISAPGVDDTLADVGVVQVVLGGANGLDLGTSTVWSQSSGIDGDLETGDDFGAALAR